jgi:hypothetical protein
VYVDLKGTDTFSWPLGIPMDVCDSYPCKLFLLGGGFFLKKKKSALFI